MIFERLTTAEHSIFPAAMDLYRASFPFHEQRESDSQRHIMGYEDYQFNLIYDENTFIGLVLCWETENFIYVEHFCILPEMRNKQYGQRALELLHQQVKPVILEIDPPIDEVSTQRKGFYTRLGYQTNPYKHCHPAYRTSYEGHELVVMSYPGLLSEQLYHEFNHYLQTTVMAI